MVCWRVNITCEQSSMIHLKVLKAKGPRITSTKNLRPISQRPQTKYVLDGLKQVLASRPKLPYRMTIHSDQGVQYQSKAYCHTLKQHRVVQSMSRKGNCHDNAPREAQPGQNCFVGTNESNSR